MTRPITRLHAASLLAVLVPATALAISPTATAMLVRGTVVHRNAHARSFVLASPNGRLTPVHTSHRPAVGRTVVASVRRLANGTYALRHLRLTGTRRRARIRGVVTYVDRARHEFTLSAEGVSMLVRRGSARASAASALPAVGTKVSVSGVLGEQGTLDAQAIKTDGSDHGAIDLEGSIVAIDLTARTLSISAEDNNLSGQSVTVSVPATLALSQFAVGDEVQLQVTLLPGGTYVLQGSSSDEGAGGAEDRAVQQGEQTDAADREDAHNGDAERGASEPRGDSGEAAGSGSSGSDSGEAAGSGSSGSGPEAPGSDSGGLPGSSAPKATDG